MSAPLVLVANEPRAYRETIALALTALRPGADVIAIEPDELDAEVKRQQPDVAVCSQLSPIVEESVPRWVLLYPDGANMAMVSIGGKRCMTGSFGLEDLAAVISPL
jgi:hypothetical protein